MRKLQYPHLNQVDLISLFWKNKEIINFVEHMLWMRMLEGVCASIVLEKSRNDRSIVFNFYGKV